MPKSSAPASTFRDDIPLARPPSPPSQQLPASLASLPPELKAQIARHLQSNDSDRRAAVHFPIEDTRSGEPRGFTLRGVSAPFFKQGRNKKLAKEDQDRVRTGLAELSLCSKEWNEVCGPFLFENVTLRLSYTKLRTFETACAIFARHADCVKGLWLKVDWRHAKVSGPPAVLDDEEPPFYESLVRSLSTCGSLQTLVLQISPSTGKKPLLSSFYKAVEPILHQLVTLAPQLTHLALDFDLNHELSTGLFSSLLASSTNLTHLILSPSTFLRLEIDDLTGNPGYRRLLSSLTPLHKLESVELWSNLPLPSYLTSLPTSWPLRRLLLDCVGPSNPHTFVDFLKRFSATLEVLELFNTPREAFYEAFPLAQNGAAPFTFTFSRLKHLTLNIPYDTSFLPYISPSTPIRSLKLAHWVPRSAKQQIRDFIRRFARGGGGKGRTLPVVEVEAAPNDGVLIPGEEEELYLDEADLVEVRGWCEESGVRLVVSRDEEDE